MTAVYKEMGVGVGGDYSYSSSRLHGRRRKIACNKKVAQSTFFSMNEKYLVEGPNLVATSAPQIRSVPFFF